MSDRTPSPASGPAPATEQQPKVMDTNVRVKEESPNPPSPIASVARNSEAPSPSPSRQTRRMTLAQRRAFLRNDPLAQEVEAHRVYCRDCQKWIKLSPVGEYSLANWQTHKQRCSGAPSAPPLRVRRTPSKPNFSPNSRVATAERKIVLLNDPQVKIFSPEHVQCGTCKVVVTLGGEVEYDLTKWTEHKKKCIPMTPAPITPRGSGPRTLPPASTSSTHSQVSAGRPTRSPTPVGEGSSSQSTETTVVTDSPPAAVMARVKRAREEETEDEEEAADDERPTNRPRTETYRPPARDTGLFGWLMEPLKEFARGFREGLGST